MKGEFARKFLILLFLIPAVIGLVIYRNYIEKVSLEDNNTEVWNGSGEFDPNFFIKERYKSGDVSLASCFESAIPNNFEITATGFLPRIGVVKPIGLDIKDQYFPYIDIRFHEDPSRQGETLLTKRRYPEIKQFIDDVVDGSSIINKEIIFTKIKLYKKTSSAIVVNYGFKQDEPVETYDGNKISGLGGVSVFVAGDNPQIIESLKLVYETSQRERDVEMFKNFLKTFEPTCLAKSKDFLSKVLF